MVSSMRSAVQVKQMSSVAVLIEPFDFSTIDDREHEAACVGAGDRNCVFCFLSKTDPNLEQLRDTECHIHSM